LSTICGFYKYCSQERMIERDPSAHVRRPKQGDESSTLGLDRNELGVNIDNHDETSRLDRHASARIVRRLTKAAGIDKRISPTPSGAASSPQLHHRSFITAALDAALDAASSGAASSPLAFRYAMSKKRHRAQTRERQCATTEEEDHSTDTPPTSSQPSSLAPAADRQRDRAGDHSDRRPPARRNAG
jgi:hypothetical protein